MHPSRIVYNIIYLRFQTYLTLYMQCKILWSMIIKNYYLLSRKSVLGTLEHFYVVYYMDIFYVSYWWII